MFIEILKNSFHLLRKNSNLIMLIFMFFILLTLITPVFDELKFNIKAIPFVLMFFAVVCTFHSGLFFAFKKSLDYENEPPKNDNPFELSPLYFSEFFQGVGGYFVKFLLAGIFIVFLFILLSVALEYFASHYIVIPEKIHSLLTTDIIFNDAKTIDFVNSLTNIEKIKIAKLSMLVLVSMGAFGFLTMLYPVILIVKEDNFFKSFFFSIKYLFKDFFVSLLIFLFFNIIITFSSLAASGSGNNIIVYAISVYLLCCLTTWYFLTLFVYYEKVK